MAEPQYHLEGIVRSRNEEMTDFQGPLDVIFLLLSKNKIEIQDVSITAILEQYLAYLDEMKRLDMDIASEFITMASHLMLLKTRMVLSEEDRQAQEEMEELIASLEARQRKRPWSKYASPSRLWNPGTTLAAACSPSSRSRCAGTRPTVMSMSLRTCCGPWTTLPPGTPGGCRRLR